MLSLKYMFIQREFYHLSKSWKELKSILLKVFFPHQILNQCPSLPSYFKWKTPMGAINMTFFGEVWGVGGIGFLSNLQSKVGAPLVG